MISTWNVLETDEQLESAIAKSYEKPVVFFKHSVACGISARSKYDLENGWNFKGEDFDFYYLDLLNFRNISNRIAETFDVRHQSPQIIIIKDGKPIFDMSHHRITSVALKSALEDIMVK